MSVKNNLLVINPELCKDWNYQKNKFGPEVFPPHSGKKVWWVCRKGHEWEARIYSRAKNHGCPYCSGRRPTGETNLLKLFPKLCEEWDYEKNKKPPENFTIKSDQKVWWVCKNNHNFFQAIKKRTIGMGCSYCCGQLPSEENNLSLNLKLCGQWSSKNILTPKDYTLNSGKKVLWVCEKGHEWSAAIYTRKDHGCPYCTGRLPSKENNLSLNLKLCGEWDYEKNRLTPKDYTLNCNKKVWWVCEKNHRWGATIANRNNGTDCPHCSKSISKPSQHWLDKLNVKIREYKIPYTNYIVDGYDPETNIVYEFYGDFWHGNPSLYQRDDINPMIKKAFGELYDETIKRENILKLMGFKIITIWESDFILI
jgi:hypothetical protein